MGRAVVVGHWLSLLSKPEFSHRIQSQFSVSNYQTRYSFIGSLVLAARNFFVSSCLRVKFLIKLFFTTYYTKRLHIFVLSCCNHDRKRADYFSGSGANFSW